MVVSKSNGTVQIVMHKHMKFAYFYFSLYGGDCWCCGGGRRLTVPLIVSRC
ncbi:hypothetical protein HanIR_Chr11g0547341 [Helianthus annuus]|nr:hypothetical protein HanIR_Chr11g0547341 [Helianthus annuus]